jgi:hypothetical protein
MRADVNDLKLKKNDPGTPSQVCFACTTTYSILDYDVFIMAKNNFLDTVHCIVHYVYVYSIHIWILKYILTLPQWLIKYIYIWGALKSRSH